MSLSWGNLNPGFIFAKVYFSFCFFVVVYIDVLIKIKTHNKYNVEYVIENDELCVFSTTRNGPILSHRRSHSYIKMLNLKSFSHTFIHLPSSSKPLRRCKCCLWSCDNIKSISLLSWRSVSLFIQNSDLFDAAEGLEQGQCSVQIQGNMQGGVYLVKPIRFVLETATRCKTCWMDCLIINTI